MRQEYHSKPGMVIKTSPPQNYFAGLVKETHDAFAKTIEKI